jgi:hypothetical protein
VRKKIDTKKIASITNITIRYVGSIGVKMTYFSIHKSMAKATRKGNKLLVESIE